MEIFAGICFLVVGVIVGKIWGEGAARCEKRSHESRVDTLIRVAASERELHMVSASRERRELYTRIQAYDPFPEDVGESVKNSPGSQVGEVVEGPHVYSSAEIAELGLIENSDGCVIDPNMGNALFLDVHEWQEYRGQLRKKGLPIDTHPEIVHGPGNIPHADAMATAAQAARARGVKGG